MTAVVMLLGGGRQRARPPRSPLSRGRLGASVVVDSRTADVARGRPRVAALESTPAGCQPAGSDTRVRRRRPDRWPAAPVSLVAVALSPEHPAGESGVRPEVERARSTPGTPTASHSSSGRPPGCRSTGCTSPGPLGPPTSCGTLRSSCTQPANPHRASPLVVRKRRSRPVGPGADPPAAEWIARIAACRCDRCLRFCAPGAVTGAGVHASERARGRRHGPPPLDGADSSTTRAAPAPGLHLSPTRPPATCQPLAVRERGGHARGTRGVQSRPKPLGGSTSSGASRRGCAPGRGSADAHARWRAQSRPKPPGNLDVEGVECPAR